MRVAKVMLLVAAICATSAAFIDPIPEQIVVKQLAPRPPEKPAVKLVEVDIEIGQPRRLILLRLSHADRVAVARRIVNEDSRPQRPISDGGTDGELTTDAYGILQVVFDWATHEKRAHGGALRALSPFVVGGRKATRRRHSVSRALPAFGVAHPVLWVDAIDGPWEVYGPNWERVRAAVRTACTRGFRAPCVEQLAAWGGDMDTSIALGRGLVPATCDPGTVNTLWAWPKPKAVSARVAAGGKRT